MSLRGTALLVTKENCNTDFKVDGKWVLWGRPEPGAQALHTRLGRVYMSMKSRGKVGGCVHRERPSYIGTTVCDEWLADSQLFCEWAVNQIGWGLGYHLDKDLLEPGNKVYKPSACCFLPMEINTSISQTFKGGHLLKDGRYEIRSSRHGCIGKYHSREEAARIAAEVREAGVKVLAEKYKATIDPRAYHTLKNWKLKILEK